MVKEWERNERKNDISVKNYVVYNNSYNIGLERVFFFTYYVATDLVENNYAKSLTNSMKLRMGQIISSQEYRDIIQATDPIIGINLDPSHIMILGADSIAADYKQIKNNKANIQVFSI